MAKHDPWAQSKPKIDAAVDGLHRKDATARDTRDRARDAGDGATLPLSGIKPRPHGDTRPLDADHVTAVAESIVAVGLLQPIVVDRKHRLVCGGHRLEAIHLLKREAPGAFARRFPDEAIPVRVLSDLDAEADRTAARVAEMEENEKRKGYTKDQVLALASSLRESGYRFTVGRPKPGEIALAPTLAVATGLSLRTVRRYLADGAENGDNGTNTAPRDPLALATNALVLASARYRAALAANPASGEGGHRVLAALDALDGALRAEHL